jgi:antitoxin VapB
MPLDIEDPHVDALATHLMTPPDTSGTSAVRRARQDKIDRQTGDCDLVERTVDFVRALRDRAGLDPKLADAAFIDSLYEHC